MKKTIGIVLIVLVCITLAFGYLIAGGFLGAYIQFKDTPNYNVSDSSNGEYATFSCNDPFYENCLGGGFIGGTIALLILFLMILVIYGCYSIYLYCKIYNTNEKSKTDIFSPSINNNDTNIDLASTSSSNVHLQTISNSTEIDIS